MPKKSNKEGCQMIQEEVRVKDGYEVIYNKAVEMKAELEEKIRKQVEAESVALDNIIKESTEIVEVEVEVEDETEGENEEVVGE
jgi:hypothetical protein